MSFRPRMQSFHEGVDVVAPLNWRSWTGIVADVWTVTCPRGAAGEYISPDPRLFIVLEQSPEDSASDAAIRIIESAHGVSRCRTCTAPNPICYIPADLRIWSRTGPLHHLRHLDLHLDRRALETRMAEKVHESRLEEPRLMFSDERVLQLARLVADECVRPSGLDDLYGDSLINALLAAVLQAETREQRKRSRLSRWQLRRSIAYIEDNCLRRIRLEELAELTGLSQSYFSHAFKASTGLPPHQWQMKARIDRVKELLGDRDASLPDIAAMTGFSDQAHLTRMFRKLVGTTPAAWRRDHVVSFHPRFPALSGIVRPDGDNTPKTFDPRQEGSIQRPLANATHSARQNGHP